MKLFKKRFLILAASIFCAGSSFALGNPEIVTILRFHEVTESIYRGARPEVAGMNQLATFGIKTDLNLEDDSRAIQAEQKVAAELGINMVSMPMSGFWRPNDNHVKDILNVLNNPSYYPIFLHCKHGEDRTGLITGFYRVFTQGLHLLRHTKKCSASGFTKPSFF